MNEEILSLMTITCLDGLSLTTIAKLIEHFGSGKEALSHIRDLAACGLNIKAAQQDKINNSLGKAKALANKEADFILAHKIQAIGIGDARYSQRLLQCDDHPIVLYYLGNSDLNSKKIISIVGTRHITDYGREACKAFVSDLSKLCPDVIIISGLAYGADICAHRSALKGGLQTIGVMANGLDRIYPTSHREDAISMIKQGGLITEFMSKARMDKLNFVQRNRIVAGLSDALIVVESAAKGGSLITADLSNDYSRDVFAFPGRIGDEMSEGTNNLIASNKAHLISSAEDFALAMNWIKKGKKSKASEAKIDPRIEALDEQTKIVYNKMRELKQASKSELATMLAMTIPAITEALFVLEEADLVKDKGAGRFMLL